MFPRNLTLWLLFLLSGLTAGAQTPPPAELLPQQPVTRQMRDGETHSYAIQAPAGQLLHIELDQQGIDVVLTLRDPGDAAVYEADNPNTAQEEETIVHVAQTAGVYRLQIALRYPGQQGRYVLSLKASRPAHSNDHLWAEAERLYTRAQLTRRSGVRTDLQNALPLFAEALERWRTLGDRNGEAKTLHRLCFVKRQVGLNNEARADCEQAVTLAQAAGNRLVEMRAFHVLGLLAGDDSRIEEALGYFSKALDAVAPLGGPRVPGTYLAMAFAWAHLHNDQQARECYQKATEILEKHPDVAGAALTYHTMSIACQRFLDYQTAREYAEKVLALRRRLGNLRDTGRAMSDLLFLYRKAGENEKGAKLALETLEIGRTSGDWMTQKDALLYLALLSGDTREYEKGLAYCDEAARFVANKSAEAHIYTVRAQLYGLMGRFAEAQAERLKALAWYRSVGDYGNELLTLYSLAKVEKEQGHNDAVLAYMKELLPVQERLRAVYRSDYDLAAFFVVAKRHNDFYIDFLMQQAASATKAEYVGLALESSEDTRARLLLASLAEAHLSIRKGVSEGLLTREKELRQTITDTAARQTRLLMQNSPPPAEVAKLDRQVKALYEKYDHLKALIRAESPAYAALTQPRALSVAEMQAQLDDDTLLLEYALGPERSYVWAVTRTGLKSYVLPPEKEINTAARRVYESWQQAPPSRARDDEAAARLGQMILAPLKEAPPNVRRLVVVADGALHYVPFAALPLPAEAKTPPQTLNARYEVVNLPSVSALAALRKQLQGRPPAERLLAVFADPVFDDKDPRVYAAVAAKTGGGPGRIEKAQLANALHGAGFRGDALGRLLDSRREAEAIIQLAKGRGAVVKKLDFDANRDQLLNGELGQYRILHFATHGLLNTQQPELSGLAFSLVDAGGQPRNGFVRLHDIYNLDLNADLVVLSACQTGLGQEVKGEGLIGLTRGFMYAGARRVVASLWQVDDEATAEFMRHFYAAMLQNNDTPAAALRRAQWQMQRSRRWRAPYYWAAFTLQGEWR